MSYSSTSTLIRIGELRRIYRSRSVAYELKLEHLGLHKHRVIRGTDSRVLEAKANAQVNDWTAQWERGQYREARTRATANARAAAAQDREAKRRYLEDQKDEAARLTEEAQGLQGAIRGTLAATLDKNDAISWGALEKPVKYATRAPKARPRPAAPTSRPVPSPPARTAPEYQPVLGFLDKLFSSRRAAREQEAQVRFDDATRVWQGEKRRIELENESALHRWQQECDALASRDSADMRQWEIARDAHDAEDRARRDAVTDLKGRYLAKDPGAVEEYCDLVLSQSEYPEFMPKEWDLEFIGETGILVVDYVLPAPEALPTLTEVKYTQASDSFSEKRLNETQRAKLYDDLAYQVVLRTIHELFEADQVQALAAVVFNGVVTAVDRSTGNEVTSCIVSVQASREPFLAINLAKVEPKQCFRNLKGVGSSALHSVTAIPPVMTMRREDGRFIAAKDVASVLGEGYNLATMPREDFEHLIRQVFEAEFAGGGGEVKVTQASRDGGVDAVVFDPDPIRGGKMVIQAKRYANTVGVSAVRDLFGTLMAEGANKGILVTTSDYGPDAYEFAKGKPLSLLNGSNLLHLLQKHGLKAHINLAEARLEAARRATSMGA